MTNQNNSSDLLRFAGDVNVSKVIITSLINGKEFNVTNQLITIQIFEDLFSPFISGSLIFRESLDFISNFPFIGEETVDLKIFTPTLDKKFGGAIEGKFYLYKLSDREDVANSSSVYQMHFISMEAVNDVNNKISKAYSGRASDIAISLITDIEGLNSKKVFNVEESSNKTKFISNFWSPIRNMNYLLEHSISTKNSPCYLFYENRYGFNYNTLDYLNSENVVQYFSYNNSQNYVSPSGGSSRIIELDYRRIVEMKVDVAHDYLARVSNGTYGSTLIYNDTTTKRYFNNKYSIFDQFDKDNRLNEFPIVSSKIFATYKANILRQTIATNTFSNFGEISNVKYIQERISRLQQAQAGKIHITVPGRTDYTVGQKIHLTNYKKAPLRETDDIKEFQDPLLTGHYLISAINHVIDKEKHTCYMELITDSLSVNLDKGGIL